ncbi:MAG: threonine/serine exporter family protein [Bacteroidales bacterium]|nr:threonine/serine exporter family protein [Bacteroidales bacterium]
MYWEIIEKAFWSGVVGFGFAVLFNVPYRLLFAIFITSLIAGLVKFAGLTYGINIIFSSLFAASLVGFLSIPISRKKHTSPFVISIPSVIGMIPGYFGYQTLLGIMHLAIGNNPDEMATLLFVTHSGINMLFVLASLSMGVSLPWLMFREKGLKKIKLASQEDLL